MPRSHEDQGLRDDHRVFAAAAWGRGSCGLPDFIGDGNVGVADLLTLLAAWGPC